MLSIESLVDLGHRRIYITMSAAYASRYETVFLCLHPKGPKMYGTKYMKRSKTFVKVGETLFRRKKRR